MSNAEVLKDVKQSSYASFTRKTKNQWDGQWKKPHGDLENDNEDDDAIARDWGDMDYGGGMVGDLRVTGPMGGTDDHYQVTNNGSKKQKFKGGFQKASSILEKYEVRK